MRRLLKKIAALAMHRFPLLQELGRRIEAQRDTAIIREWEERGCPAPPPHSVKRQVVREYATKYGLKTLVETGTYRGDMVQAMIPFFDRICSIELSEKLWSEARKRFDRIRHVELVHGDSAQQLGVLMKTIDRPALFWLDAHYSGGITARAAEDTPIFDELRTILVGATAGAHVILIDDARYFGTDPAYPTTDELEDFVRSRVDNVQVNIKDDIIIITPARTSKTR